MKILMGIIVLVAVWFSVVVVMAEDHQGIVVRRPFQERHEPKGPPKPTTPVITFHGGPVITAVPSVYLIYYGTFSAGSQSIINDFMNGLTGSPQYYVHSVYYDGANNSVPGT